MPHATTDATRIHYTTTGTGPPLLLHHGFSSSAAAWQDFGYVQALAEHRTLILIDARGHGQSPKPYNPESYALEHRVTDVLAVLDDLRIDRAEFLGYSMGGWVGFGLGVLAPHRFTRMVLGGAHPFADDAWSHPFNPADGSAFIAAFQRAIGEPIPPDFHPLILDNDRAALAASAGPRTSLEADLHRIAMPTLLYAGERDARIEQIARAAPALPAAAFLRLPGLSHVDAYVRADLVVPHVLEFLGIASAAAQRAGRAPER